MVSLTINLISRTHHSCEMRDYVFMVLRKYTNYFIIFLQMADIANFY